MSAELLETRRGFK